MSEREWGWDWQGYRGSRTWWRTPYLAVRFGRCWMVSLALGPWHFTFGYTEMF